MSSLQHSTYTPKTGIERFVHISAIGADVGSEAAYGRTKGEAEQAVLATVPTATILRPSVIFGAGDGFLNRFASMATGSPWSTAEVRVSRLAPLSRSRARQCPRASAASAMWVWSS